MEGSDWSSPPLFLWSRVLGAKIMHHILLLLFYYYLLDDCCVGWTVKSYLGVMITVYCSLVLLRFVVFIFAKGSNVDDVDDARERTALIVARVLGDLVTFWERCFLGLFIFFSCSGSWCSDK